LPGAIAPGRCFFGSAVPSLNYPTYHSERSEESKEMLIMDAG
jgi:hypothetical protein